jgi:hypothetical protein
MKMRETAIRAWVSIWYVVYVVLRVLLRYLIGKHRRGGRCTFWDYIIVVPIRLGMVVYSHAMSLMCTG